MKRKRRRSKFDLARRRDYNLQRHYGITTQQYELLLVRQGRRCAICRVLKADGEVFHVDHDHETNDVRGLLCGRCNTGIGMLGDSIAILILAVLYLRRHAMPGLFLGTPSGASPPDELRTSTEPDR